MGTRTLGCFLASQGMPGWIFQGMETPWKQQEELPVCMGWGHGIVLGVVLTAGGKRRDMV